MAQTVPIDLRLDAVAAVCRQYGVARLALFGSVLREDFTAGSDIDVLTPQHGDESCEVCGSHSGPRKAESDYDRFL